MTALVVTAAVVVVVVGVTVTVAVVVAVAAVVIAVGVVAATVAVVVAVVTVGMAVGAVVAIPVTGAGYVREMRRGRRDGRRRRGKWDMKKRVERSRDAYRCKRRQGQRGEVEGEERGTMS